MKKLIVHTLIALYLIGTTELSQLLKLGYFVEHYIEHKSINEELSILDFIDIHYVQPTVIDDDYAEDMQLPFKTHNDCHSSILNNIINDTNREISIITPFITYAAQHKAYINPTIKSQYLDEIFQPPRNV